MVTVCYSFQSSASFSFHVNPSCINLQFWFYFALQETTDKIKEKFEVGKAHTEGILINAHMSIQASTCITVSTHTHTNTCMQAYTCTCVHTHTTPLSHFTESQEHHRHTHLTQPHTRIHKNNLHWTALLQLTRTLLSLRRQQIKNRDDC